MNYNQRTIKDVLFKNGSEIDMVPQSYRYRILHQIEHLNAAFLDTDKVFYLNFNPLIARDYRIIIIFLCPLTNNFEKAITLAKNLNKKILFDIDDLVIDIKYTEIIPYIKTLSKNEKFYMWMALKELEKRY